jgi:hypothetical protein
MNKKGSLSIVFWALLFVATALAAIFLVKKLVVPFPKEEPVATAKPESALLLAARLTADNQIEVVIKPRNGQEILLTAFSLEGTISSADEMLVLKPGAAVVPNPALTEEKWGFPIAKISQNSKGEIILELSGYHLGQLLYQLDKATVLATIPLASGANQSSLKISLNEENTKFLGTRALERIPIAPE